MIEQPVKRYRGQRGPNKVKKTAMTLISVRLPKEVVEYFEGSTIRMRETLVDHVRRSRSMDELQ